MTAKHGTQWKTSWRRQKPALASNPVPMWFFHNNNPVQFSNFAFRQPLTAPSIGDAQPPFWIGMIVGSDPSPVPLAFQEVAAVFRTNAWNVDLEHFSPLSGLPAELAARADVILSLDAVPVSPLNPPLSPIPLRAVVLLLVVEPVLGGHLVTLWIDGAVRRQNFIPIANPYVPGVGTLTVSPGHAFLNSMAGGNALPTNAEIQAWFSASRYAAPFPSAQAIPGKTLDRYDAGVTPGVVPNPLVNLVGGQNAPMITNLAPLPVNLLVPATFGY